MFEAYIKIRGENSNLVEIGQKYSLLYVKTSLCFRGTDFNIYDIADSDTCTSTMQKERIVQVCVAKVVKRRCINVTLYVSCLYCF